MKITQQMADDAASKMASKVYNSKIEEAVEEQMKLGDKMYEKYTPKEIVDVMLAFPSFFSLASTVRLSHEGSSEVTELICSRPCMPISNWGNPEKCFLVEDKEYSLAVKVNRKIKDIYNQKSGYAMDVKRTLLMLKTSNRVKEAFPEALEFLPSDGNLLPSVDLAALRKPLIDMK